VDAVLELMITGDQIPYWRVLRKPIHSIRPFTLRLYAMSSNLCSGLKAKIDKVVATTTTEAEFYDAFADTFSPLCRVDINGLIMNFDQFKAFSLRHIGMLDRKNEWKVLFGTDEATFPQGLEPKLQGIALYYVLTAKSPPDESGKQTVFENHRCGSGSVDKDGKLVDFKMTAIVKAV